MIIKILIAFACIAVIVAIAVSIKLKTEAKEKMYLAAERVLQNRLLDNELKNPFLKGTVIEEPTGQQLMIQFTARSDKHKQNYVFSPSDPITFGRDRAKNKIAVNEALVSTEHCRIFLSQDGSPVLQDTSSNGTVIKRGFRSYAVANGQTCVIANGDKLRIGTAEFKIKLFYYDMTWL